MQSNVNTVTTLFCVCDASHPLQLRPSAFLYKYLFLAPVSLCSHYVPHSFLPFTSNRFTSNHFIRFDFVCIHFDGDQTIEKVPARAYFLTIGHSPLRTVSDTD